MVDDILAAGDVGFGPRCLVTGGAGYLGTALVRRLLELGLMVRSFDARAPDPIPAGLEHVSGDVRDADALCRAAEGIDTVFHTAAVISLLRIYPRRLRDEVMAINLGGTRNAIRACRSQGVRRLVYTSSHNIPIDREIVLGDESLPDARQFLDLYTETKALAERAVLGADTAGGLRAAALRPAGLWGPGPESVMVRSFLEQLAGGRLAALPGDGTAEIDNTHVENLVDAEILAAQGLADAPDRVGGEFYYITDDEPGNGIEWFRPLAEGLGYPWPRRRVPGSLLYGIGSLLEWVHRLGGPVPDLTRSGVLKITRTCTFRIDKARRELGYTPRFQRANGMPACIEASRGYAKDPTRS